MTYKKKILILGVGAQGSTVAKFMDKEDTVAEIICADYDEKAVNYLVDKLEKGRGTLVDANNTDSIARAAEGVDLVVNALPAQFGFNVFDAAIKAKTNYQDFTAPDIPGTDWVKNIKKMYTEIGPRFKAVDRTALISTGSAPGLINIAARDAMRYLDSCETIYMLVYEGVKAKRFLPFWWSVETAYTDMVDDAYCFEDGEIIVTEPFSRPVYEKFKHVDEEIKLIEHAHDEPVIMGINADKYFRGAKNIYFKYGGTGVEFAETLYKMGMLSREPVEVDGCKVVPLNLAIKLTPPAPKYREEIQEIIEEGLESDTGAMVIKAFGEKDGEKVLVETYVDAPGLVDSFERSGLTAEMYLTGQGGALFTKMFADDKIDQKGLISSDMMTMEQVDYYLQHAAKLDITLDTEVKKI